MKTITKRDIVIPKHKKDSHKGQNGEVLVIGGNEDYVGAVALAALSALRTGIDWITVAAPAKAAWSINALAPDLVTKKMPGKYLTLKNYNALMKLVDLHDVVLIGNGMGRKKETVALIRKLIKNIKIPMVLDSDALKCISLDEVNNSILCPHKKEYELLMKHTKITTDDLKKHIRNNVIIEKRPIDRIISSKRTLLNKTGNEGMTTGGTGDVLAGFAAGFLAQGLSLEQSAINAAYINGTIGDALKKRKGYSFIASDIISDYDKVVKGKKWQ